MFLGRLETVGSCIVHLSYAKGARGASRSEEFVHYSMTARKGPKCIDVVWTGSASYLIVTSVGI